MIPRALIPLKEAAIPENFQKIRKLLTRYLDHLRSLDGNQFHGMFVSMVTHKAISDTDLIQFYPDPSFKLEDLRSYTKNVINVFKNEGPQKEFYTYLTENPNKPQKQNTNKKYPNLLRDRQVA